MPPRANSGTSTAKSPMISSVPGENINDLPGAQAASSTKSKRSKYGAEKTTVDGITFASKKEATRYGELRLMEKAGEITGLRVQPRFDLDVIGGFVKDVRVMIGAYVGDFQYVERRGGLVVEDVKSPATRTPLYRWKIKHLKAQYGITVTEV